MELLEIPMRMGHHGGPGYGGPGFGFFGFLWMLLTLVLVVAVVLLLVKGRVGPVRWVGRGPGHHPGHPGHHHPGTHWAAAHEAEDAALQTLRMRLANGEISPEEYMERTSVLRSHTPPPPPEGEVK